MAEGQHTDAKQQASQTAEQTKQRAKQQADKLTDQAKQQARSQAAGQQERAAENLGGIAQALHQTGDNLREEDQGTMARYVDDAAGQVERFAGFLRDRSPDELLHEAERFARREPALFMGGAFALGLLGARFLKSSRPSQGSSQDSSHDGTRRQGRMTRADTAERGYNPRAAVTPQRTEAMPSPAAGAAAGTTGGATLPPEETPTEAPGTTTRTSREDT